MFTLLVLLGSVFNYLIYPIIARIVGVSSFGEFIVVMSIVTQITIVMLAFNIISIFYVNKLGDKDSRELLASVQKLILFIVFIIFIITCFFLPIIETLLKINNFSTLLIMTLIIAFSIPSSFWSGYFQGKGELIKVGVYILVSAVLKLIFGFIFGYLYSLNGALVGILLGTMAGLVIFWILPGLKPPIVNGLLISKKDIKLIAPHARYILVAVITVGIVSIFQIVDLIIVRILQNNNLAGQYSGISSISRIVLFIGFILVWIILPEIAKAIDGHLLKLIKKSYLIYGLIGFISIIGSFLLNDLIIKTLLGNIYALDRNVFMWSTIFQFSVLIMSFQAFVLLTLNNLRVIATLAFGVVFLILTFILNNNTGILAIIKLCSYIVIIICILLGIQIYTSARKLNE